MANPGNKTNQQLHNEAEEKRQAEQAKLKAAEEAREAAAAPKPAARESQPAAAKKPVTGMTTEQVKP